MRTGPLKPPASNGSCVPRWRSRLPTRARRQYHVATRASLRSSVGSTPSGNHSHAWGAFALLLAVGGWVILTATTSLADEVFRHIHEMPAALSFGRGTSHEMLATGALRGIGAEATGDLGDVLFANLCVFKERRIAHIILKGRSAPVTVMIMPREPVSAPRHIWSDDQKGVLVPYRRGSLAIVSAYIERLDVVETRIRAALTWGEKSEIHPGA